MELRVYSRDHSCAVVIDVVELFLERCLSSQLDADGSRKTHTIILSRYWPNIFVDKMCADVPDCKACGHALAMYTAQLVQIRTDKEYSDKHSF